MLKIIFIILVGAHGLIHLLGFLKSFQFADISQLTIPISRSAGVAWLFAAIGFLLVALLFSLDKNWWPWLAFPILLVSQILIIQSWADAKFGTIANIIILLVAVVVLGEFLLQRRFDELVSKAMEISITDESELLLEKDIAHLPSPVQRYLRYTHSLNKPKVKNFFARFSGGMRGAPEESFMQLQSAQYNFYQTPSRYFFMKAKKMGLPATGLHVFENERATFRVYMLNWFPVVDAQGDKMTQSETVTLFNDMCFIAPATLIDKRITWSDADHNRVHASFKYAGFVVQADLFFNDEGQLVNFISNDRYHTDGKNYWNYPWETPVSDYKDFNGYRLPGFAKLIYKRPDGDFTYGELKFEEVRYNVNEQLRIN